MGLFDEVLFGLVSSSDKLTSSSLEEEEDLSSSSVSSLPESVSSELELSFNGTITFLPDSVEVLCVSEKKNKETIT